MSRERRQALILAAGWVALTVVGVAGLTPRQAAILAAAAAVVLGGIHFLLVWASDPELDSAPSHEAIEGFADEPAQDAPPVETPRPRLTEKRLSHLAELADVGLVQATRDGAIDFASSRARDLLDIDLDLAPSEAWRQAFDALRSQFSPDTTSAGMVHVVTTHGPTTLSLKAHPVEDEDWSGYLVQVRDRKLIDALESDLRFASRLRVLNRLYLGVAHDLKGPLNAIMLTLEGLRADIEEGSGEAPEHVERLEVIREELARHHRSLETVLAQTAPERLDRQTFDLRTVVDHVARLIRPQLRQQKVELDVEGAEPAFVHTIQDRVREALLALTVNAMEAMPFGGRLTIATSARPQMCSIDVRDTGEGIPDEIRERIFDLRFTTKDSGTGIGLSTARSVVESEHGSIDIIETGEEGSTFRISLPSAERE